MEYETVSAEDFGKSLSGLGLNLLVRDVPAQCAFLRDVFGMAAHRVSADFAIVTYGGQAFQIHADHTYHSNPLLGLLPETPPRGAGVEIRLYNSDPDAAAARAEAAGGTVLQPPTDKPHGLRETYILCPNGYAWVASRPLQPPAPAKSP
ncbi:glyoxalase [Pseudooceanicola lipolyticus]|uniref:Glyoxalase n=1 Tax=Pseudooceanicola lipolyticus TaxID=2029104 RepID=A0A2M8IUS6_9RHOB|nr:VOC family protein [Pseudooceanicola lipolyticus]PJE34276.1 glyoxalase [Pseudooceanicola lipolyticus]